MKRFLIQTSVFVSMVAASVFFIFLQADGTSDPFYLRFTTGKQTSLILGNSRAAQGIRPDVLNRELQRTDLFNYSFTLPASPYGKIYLKSISRKLNEESKDGVFILSVDPWSVSDRLSPGENTKGNQDAKSILATTPIVNMDPNIFYLVKNYDKPYFNLLLNRKSSMLLHHDGWLEVSVPSDTASVNKRIKSKITEYAKHLALYQISDSRIGYLKQTIAYLKRHGEVYLVRLPVHPKMMEIESTLAPGFSQMIKEIADENEVSFFDLTYLNDQSVYTDGNHLQKESGALISKQIGRLILDTHSPRQMEVKN